MITLTITVPNPAQVLAAGYTTMVLQKSSTQTQAGPYTSVNGATAALDPNTTSYALTDVSGGPGDWYSVVYTQNGGANPSAPGTPQPGYLSDLCNTARDLLGVSTNEASDAQIQGYAYLPTALAHVRTRVPGFDATVAAGGDLGALCLASLAHYTAALLCPRMTVAVVDSEQFKDYRYQRNRQMDWTATQTALLAQYEVLVSQAAQETADLAALSDESYFVVGGPTSGGMDTSGGLLPAQADPYENPLGPFDPGWNPNT